MVGNVLCAIPLLWILYEPLFNTFSALYHYMVQVTIKLCLVNLCPKLERLLVQR
jgi:hypothetical protein